MSPEDLHIFSHDRLLLTMFASANDVHDMVRRTEELIEQTRKMLRELDTHGVNGRRML